MVSPKIDNMLKWYKGRKGMYAEFFRERLKQARLESGFTQKEVARETGIAQNVISRFECGTRQPDLESIGKLIDFYKKSADYFFGTGNNK